MCTVKLLAFEFKFKVIISYYVKQNNSNVQN